MHPRFIELISIGNPNGSIWRNETDRTELNIYPGMFDDVIHAYNMIDSRILICLLSNGLHVSVGLFECHVGLFEFHACVVLNPDSWARIRLRLINRSCMLYILYSFRHSLGHTGCDAALWGHTGCDATLSGHTRFDAALSGRTGCDAALSGHTWCDVDSIRGTT